MARLINIARAKQMMRAKRVHRNIMVLASHWN